MCKLFTKGIKNHVNLVNHPTVLLSLINLKGLEMEECGLDKMKLMLFPTAFAFCVLWMTLVK